MNKVEGHTSLIRTTAVNAIQFKLVQELISWNNNEPKMRRKDLKAGHLALRGKKASPYFIAKNLACQVKGEHGLYNLGVLKLSAAAAKAPSAETPKATTTKPAAKAKKTPVVAKKGAAPKKENAEPKKGTSKKKAPMKEAPVEIGAAPEATDAPANEPAMEDAA